MRDHRAIHFVELDAVERASVLQLVSSQGFPGLKKILEGEAGRAYAALLASESLNKSELLLLRERARAMHQVVQHLFGILGNIQTETENAAPRLRYLRSIRYSARIREKHVTEEPTQVQEKQVYEYQPTDREGNPILGGEGEPKSLSSSTPTTRI